MANVSSVCLTPACLHASSQILWSMAPQWKTMDPCTQFDEMVCYGWKEQHDDDDGTLDTIQSRSYRILRNILEGTYPAATQVRSSLGI
jgi:endothelin-converting enzyme